MARTRTFLYPVDFGVSSGNDNNACAVRSYANVHGISFEEAQKLFAASGREFGCGTYPEVFHKLAVDSGLKYMGIFGRGASKSTFACYSAEDIRKTYMYDNVRNAGMTLATFCKTYNKGIYMVHTTGHLTTVKNGRIIDSQANRGNAAVITAYKKPE